MEFGRGKCVMLIMKLGKRLLTEGLELPNQERIRTFRKMENYLYMGILEVDTNKQALVGKKLKCVPRKNKKNISNQVLQQKSNQRNKDQGSSSGKLFMTSLKMDKRELRQMN